MLPLQGASINSASNAAVTDERNNANEVEFLESLAERFGPNGELHEVAPTDLDDVRDFTFIVSGNGNTRELHVVIGGALWSIGTITKG